MARQIAVNAVGLYVSRFVSCIDGNRPRVGKSVVRDTREGSRDGVFQYTDDTFSAQKSQQELLKWEEGNWEFRHCDFAKEIWLRITLAFRA